MRSLATYALLAGATTARMSLYQNPYDYFGTCMNSDLGDVNECREKGKADAQCCKFEVVQDSRNSVVGKFCVKDSQRFDARKNELWAGTYRDHDYTLWKWECLKPAPEPEPEPEVPEEPEEKEEEKPEEEKPEEEKPKEEEEKPKEEEEKPKEEEEKPKEEEEKPKEEEEKPKEEEEKPEEKDEEKPDEKPKDEYYDDDGEKIEETVYDEEELTFDEYQEKKEEAQKAQAEEEEAEEELWLPAWSSYKDKDMDLVLKITYWSGYAWVFGWILMIPLGTVLYSWMMLYSMWTFWEMLFGVGDFGTWFMGPVRRAWVGSFIYMLAVANSTVPLWNILTSYYCGVWAYYDYFDYNYDDELGPLPPVKPEDAEDAEDAE